VKILFEGARVGSEAHPGGPLILYLSSSHYKDIQPKLRRRQMKIVIFENSSCVLPLTCFVTRYLTPCLVIPTVLLVMLLVRESDMKVQDLLYIQGQCVANRYGAASSDHTYQPRRSAPTLQSKTSTSNTRASIIYQWCYPQTTPRRLLRSIDRTSRLRLPPLTTMLARMRTFLRHRECV